MRSKESAKIHPRVCLAIQVLVPRAEEVDRIARDLGISRHKLVTRAFDAGLPLVVESARRPDDDPPHAA